MTANAPDHTAKRLRRDLQADDPAAHRRKQKYTKETSEARRIQLDELKQRRRRTRTEMLLDTVDVGPHRPAMPSDRQLLAEIRHIAMGSVMPSPTRFDHTKPVTWPNADEVCAALGMSWDEIAEELGLKTTRREAA